VSLWKIDRLGFRNTFNFDRIMKSIEINKLQTTTSLKSRFYILHGNLLIFFQYYAKQEKISLIYSGISEITTL